MEAENTYIPEPLWPYHYLLWAILERAIYDALGQATDIYTGDTWRKLAADDAYHWIMDRNPPPSDTLFTFQDICQYLDLSCEKVRNTVKLAKEGKIDIARQSGKRKQPGVTMMKLFG